MFKVKKKMPVSPYKMSRDALKEYINSLKADGVSLYKENLVFFDYNFINKSAYLHLSGVLCDKSLFLTDENGKIIKYDINEIDSAECSVGVGCVSFICKMKESETELFRADMSHLKNLMQLPALITAFKAGEKREVRERRGVCPKCKRPYSPGSNACSKCDKRKGLFKKIIPFAKPHLTSLVVCILLFFCVSALNLLSPYLNRLLIDKYISPQDGVFPTDRSLFIPLISAIALTSLGVTIVSIFRSILALKIGNRISADFRSKLFNKVQELTLSCINRYSSGEIIKRVTSDTDMMKALIVNLVPELFQQLIILFSVLPMIVAINPKLALIIFLPMPIIVVLYYFSNRFIRRMYHRQWRADAELNTYIHDVFKGIRVVKSFGCEKREHERFDKVAKKQAKIAEYNECVWNLIIPSIGFLIGIGEYAVLFFVGTRVIDGSMSLGEMSQLLSYVGIIYGPLRWMSSVPRRLSRILTSLSKAFELVDEESEMKDDDSPVTDDITGNIQLNNVGFGYEEGTDVLKGVSFKINKGEMVGLVGRSGVGKSTLINLVMRMYDASEGEITIDGVDIKKYSQNHLRSNIGVVLQETFLFKGTVYSNIAYAKPNATPEEVINSAKLASAHDFIMRMPDGYNTYIGEGGSTLSGGERQRIAIARAVLRNPKILILDEATSSLDTDTEADIQNAIHSLIKDRTTIAIAHRLSTLRNASKLVVLDKGRVEEEGTHEELLLKQGRYYKLVMAQRNMYE